MKLPTIFLARRIPKIAKLVPATVLAALLTITAMACDAQTADQWQNQTEEEYSVDTARFLMQATLGFNRSEYQHARVINYKDWITEQLSKEATRLEPHIEFLAGLADTDLNKSRSTLPYHKVKSAGNNVGYLNFSTAWLRSILHGDDLLRQRVAWALSQILVASNRTNKLTEASANYYDMLLDGAFDDYESLLLRISYHPLMGRYLTYMGNMKSNPSTNVVPDENYAREIMQLFSIGLWQLEDNGNQKLDSNGSPIATYSNEDIRSLARVFTGFWLKDTPFGKIEWNNFDEPMVIHRKHHDRLAKTALDGYISIPAGMNPDKEVASLIKSLAQHPNTAPFVSRKLIQHLVTSNPSPEYIQDIVEVWRANNGNLGKVISAILLHSSARDGINYDLRSPAKLKEPIVRVTSLIKLLDCGKNLGKGPSDYPGLQWWHPYLSDELNQSPLGAGSVFNFYDANYANPGAIAKENLVSPEFDLIDAVSSARFTNYVWQGLNTGFHRHPSENADFQALTCDLEWESKLLNTSTDSLIKYLNLMLAAGSMPEGSKRLIQSHMGGIDNPIDQVRAAILGVAMSPEGAILK